MLQQKLFDASSPTLGTKLIRSLATSNAPSDGVFGWYKYVQDFPGEFALSWLKRIGSGADLIWEPFSGSGTTLVAAKMLGMPSAGYDMNPFMVDVAKAKLDWTLRPDEIEKISRQIARRCGELLPPEPAAPQKARWAEYDAILADEEAIYPDHDKKLAKWISPRVLRRCQVLLAEVARIEQPRYRRFLRLAAAHLLIPASNMSFRPNICYESRPTADYPLLAAFDRRVQQMITDYRAVVGRPSVKSTVGLGDARTAGPLRADVIFTSPPYPNDMEYVHQTRLELALLDHVSGAKSLTVLKKQMISSSVKLVYKENDWQKTKGREVAGVERVYLQLAETLAGRNWGWNAADMVAQYYGGMRMVLANWRSRLSRDGVAAVVIGDSAFNGVKVHSDSLLAEAAEVEGFEVSGVEPFRSRWNPKHDIELRESVVLLKSRVRTARKRRDAVHTKQRKA